MDPKILQMLMSIKAGGMPGGGMGSMIGDGGGPLTPGVLGGLPSGQIPPGDVSRGGGLPPQLLQMIAARQQMRGGQGPMPGNQGGMAFDPRAKFGGARPALGRQPRRSAPTRIGAARRPVSAGGGTVAQALGS
jgi:hypothetical protein